MRNKLLKTSTIIASVALPLSVVVSCSNANDESRQVIINKLSKVFNTLKGVDDPYVSSKYTISPSTFTLGNIEPYTVEDLGIENQIDFEDLNYKIFIQSIDDELGTLIVRIDLSHPDDNIVKLVKVTKIKGYYATRDTQDEIDLTQFMSTFTSANYVSNLTDRTVIDVYNTYKTNANVRFEDLGIVSGASTDAEGNPVEIDVPSIDWTGYTYSIKLTNYQDYEDRDTEAYILGNLTVTKGNVFKKRDFKIKGYQSTYDVANNRLNSAEEIMRQNEAITTSKSNALASSIGQPGSIVTQEQLGISIPLITGVTYRLTIESIEDNQILVRYRLTSGALSARTGSILVMGYRSVT